MPKTLAPFFNAQFFADDGTPLAGGKLHAYVSGTTTNQATFQDQAGASTNTNPIILDSAGRCNLWLTENVEYTFVLKTAADATIKTWDDVGGSAAAGASVTSVNTETGAVVLTADDIGFTTGTSTTWFTGTDVGAALDSIITRANSGVPAASVAIVDAGALYTATNVETALAEVRNAVGSITSFPSQSGAAGKYLYSDGTNASWNNPLPTQTGNSGKFLGTDGTNASWQTAGAGVSTQTTNGTITFPGGLIMKWGTTGTIATDTETDITFTTAFPTNCFAVVASPSTDLNTSGSGVRYSIAATNFTTAQFHLVNDGDNGTTATWIAIGN